MSGGAPGSLGLSGDLLSCLGLPRDFRRSLGLVGDYWWCCGLARDFYCLEASFRQGLGMTDWTLQGPLFSLELGAGLWSPWFLGSVSLVAWSMVFKLYSFLSSRVF